MSVSEHAGQLADAADLVDVDALIGAYFDERPDPSEAGQRVAFGTSGHRGTSTARTFNEAHVLAIAEAICRYRKEQGIDGPLFLGRDTHALSEPAAQTIVEVLCAHGVEVMVDADDGFTPTPAVSHAILTHNRGGGPGTADGIVVTPSHNPPAGRRREVQPAPRRAGRHRRDGLDRSARPTRCSRTTCATSSARRTASSVHRHDYVSAYVDDLPAVIDLAAIRDSGLRLGVDPLGGASVAYWAAIAERHGLDLTITNDQVDPTFRFVPLDWDGKIRMDCSSPYAMAKLRDLRRPVRRRLRQRPRRRPPRDRHAGRRAAEPQPPPRGVHQLPLRRRARLAAGHGGGQDARLERDHRPRRRRPRPPRASRSRSASSGSSTGCSTARSASAARRARAPPSCAATAAPWSTDKDGLIPCLLAAEMTAATATTRASATRR